MGCGDQELPEAPPEVCGLEKDRGPSRNFSVRWSFDMEYGGCSRFWYAEEMVGIETTLKQKRHAMKSVLIPSEKR